MRSIFRLLSQRRNNIVKTRRSTLGGPEFLEPRQVFAGSPFVPFAGRDTSDRFMVPATKLGDPPNPQWNMEKVRAADVWWLYDGSPKSIVVVEDYGVDFRHEDFGASATTQGQFWDYGKIFSSLTNNLKFSRKGRDDFNYPVDIQKQAIPPNWTEVTKPDTGQYFGNIGASIIGAKTNNNLGVAGINWDVQIYSAKVVVSDTTNHDYIAKRANRMVQYLRLGKIDGIQNNPNPQLIRAVSFGYCSEKDYGDIFNFFSPVPETAPDLAGHYDFVALGQGIKQLTGGDATQGILVTVPTGDYSKTWPTKYYVEGTWAPWTPWQKWDPNYPLASGYSPGAPDNILAVAATDIYDRPWVGNAKNPIDIYAPGVDIRSIGEQSQSYVIESGTRQAQAHVAGAIALLYDVAQQHGFSPTYHDVREAIIEGGDNIGLDKPRLNILNSIKYLSLLLGKDLTQRPNPLQASVSISGGIGAEGDLGASTATFTLRLSRAIDVPVTIGVQIEDASATVADRDYVQPGNAGLVMVTVPAKSTSATFAVNVNGDRRIEADESFTARIVTVPGNLTVASNASLAVWTIRNDDVLSTVSVAAARALEGSALQPGWARVLATLNSASQLPVTAQFSVIDDTAKAGVDFTLPSRNVITFAAGVTSVPIDIRMVGDASPEPNKVFRVQIDSVVNGTRSATSSSALVTVVDDDRILVTIQPAGQAALVAGATMMRFTVRLAAPSATPVQVSYRTLDGAGPSAAIAGTDYQAASGTLVFNPGETSRTIDVVVLARRSGQRYPRDFSLEIFGVSAVAWLANGVSSQRVIGRIS